MAVTATLNEPEQNATIAVPGEIHVDVTIAVTAPSTFLRTTVLAWHGLQSADPGDNPSAANIAMVRDENNAAHWRSPAINVGVAGNYRTRIWTVETPAPVAGPTADLTATGGGPGMAPVQGQHGRRPH